MFSFILKRRGLKLASLLTVGEERVMNNNNKPYQSCPCTTFGPPALFWAHTTACISKQVI